MNFSSVLRALYDCVLQFTHCRGPDTLLVTRGHLSWCGICGVVKFIDQELGWTFTRFTRLIHLSIYVRLVAVKLANKLFSLTGYANF